MTFAPYGHLRIRESPLWMAILVSWVIAFAEYGFQVARKPDRVLSIFPGPTQDHPGSHHADRLFDFFRHIPATAVPMERCGRVCVYRRRGIL